jgi:hypothetical protein
MPNCDVCNQLAVPTKTGCYKCGNPPVTEEAIAELEANPLDLSGEVENV